MRRQARVIAQGWDINAMLARRIQDSHARVDLQQPAHLW